jgi:hypothetical protein
MQFGGRGSAFLSAQGGALAERARALAEQILGRIPTAVPAQELHDEIGERLSIRVDTIKGLLAVLAGDARKAGSGRVIPALGMDDQRARIGVIVDVLAAYRACGGARPGLVDASRGRNRASISQCSKQH